jgi:hypothetical protein
MFIFDLNTLTYLITKLKTKFISTEILSLKVDKVEGKQLSSNNFSDEYKNKLDNKFDDVKIKKVDDRVTIVFYSNGIEVKTIEFKC